MEVHAHSHTARKKWTHYLWEFIMLFLAVFCGFLAENQREHYVENQREKKFARRLLSDIREDSTFFQVRLQKLQERQKVHAQFMEIMTGPVKPTDSVLMSNFFLLLKSFKPEFTTATYSQMKASGSLRYIQNDDLTTALQKYYEIMLPRANYDAEGVDKHFTEYTVPYMIKHFRFQDLNTLNDSAYNKKYVILDRTPGSDQELINIMGINDAACNAMLRKQTPAMKKAVELIDLIKKEYHLN
jgi:hypothetical protein